MENMWVSGLEKESESGQSSQTPPPPVFSFVVKLSSFFVNWDSTTSHSMCEVTSYRLQQFSLDLNLYIKQSAEVNYEVYFPAVL